MGHMLIVAMFAYLCTVEIPACTKRLCNNYFGGLFHDLPEVLTRDIVSPVKSSIEGLDDLIKQIETRQVQQQIFPLLPVSWQTQLNYFVQDEFSSKIILDGEIQTVDSATISALYNKDQYSPIDGELIRACDHLAAYIEAKLSMTHGISSRHLTEGAKSLYTKYENKVIAGINFGQLFDYFK
jgi:putative hydrolase of HD superfamily